MSRCRQLACLGVLALILAATAPAAVACNEPTLGVDASSVHPGDTVGFSIDHLSPGAQWSVNLGGQTVASGVAAGNTVSGSFTVPDLGDTARQVNVASLAVHDDIPGGEYPSPPHPLQYSKPSAAAPPPEASSTTATSTQATPAQPASQATPVSSGPAPKTTHPAKQATKPKSSSPSQPAHETTTQRPGHRDTVTRPRETQSPAKAPAPAVTTAPEEPSAEVPTATPAHVAATQRAGHTRKATATAARRVPIGTAARLRHLAADLPTIAPLPRADATNLPTARERVPAIPIAAGVMAAALLALALAVFVRRRRNGTGSPQPVPDDPPQSPQRIAQPLGEEERRMLAIEAELQEIVAEGSHEVARSP